MKKFLLQVLILLVFAGPARFNDRGKFFPRTQRVPSRRTQEILRRQGFDVILGGTTPLLIFRF